MNEFEYSKKQGIELMNKILIPKGYAESEEHTEPYWYKEYEVVDGHLWLTAIIKLDLTAEVSPNKLYDSDTLFVKSYWWEYKGIEDETEIFIEGLKEVKKELIKDLDEVYKIFQDTFAEKKSEDTYTFTCIYTDYGQVDEMGIPGVETEHEEEFDSLDEALNEFYMSVSFNEEAYIYKGNKDITEETINNEDLFKKFYADKNALKCCNFNSLTYNQAWQCVKEYAVDGYSSSMQEYIEQGIVK